MFFLVKRSISDFIIMKLICIGRNYTEHIKELKNERPTNPVVFLKPDTSILLKETSIFYSRFFKRYTSRSRNFSKDK